MAEILQALALELDKEEKVICLSTEELLYEINEINKLNNENDDDNNNDDEGDDKLVIFSQDFDRMYTSLHIPTVCQIAADEYYNSNLEIDVDVIELGLYLAIVCDRQQLIDLGLGDVTHTRRHNRGPKPGITTAEVMSRSYDTVSKFVVPQRSPTNDEKRLMTKLEVGAIHVVDII